MGGAVAAAEPTTYYAVAVTFILRISNNKNVKMTVVIVIFFTLNWGDSFDTFI